VLISVYSIKVTKEYKVRKIVLLFVVGERIR
jgi:hypothetical protein